jgi:hypothetical protein
MPTLTLTAQDVSGRDVVDARVLIDGNPVSEKLDGKAIAVNPGVHVFRFEAQGGASAEERVVVSEGEKARKITVILQTKETSLRAPAREQKSSGSAVPWIIMGAGAAVAAGGLVVRWIGTNDYPEGCSRGNPGTCAPSTGIADATVRETERRDRTATAENAENREIFGLWTMVAGGAVFATGLTWLIIRMASSPTVASPKPTSATLWAKPIFGGGMAGVSGAF